MTLVAHGGVAVLAGRDAPNGTANFASAMAIAVKSCPGSAPLRGLTATA